MSGTAQASESGFVRAIKRRALLRSGAGAAVVAATFPAATQLRTPTSYGTPTPLGLHMTEQVASSLDAYARGVAAMRALPSTDRRSWEFWANIHNKYCPHGNWYFLPWHRAFLVGLENMIRSLIGQPDFALPYWDWTNNPRLPEAFTALTWNGQANPLRDTTRRASPTATLPEEMVGRTVMDTIYGITDFALFGTSQPTGQNSLATSWQRQRGIYGLLEATPHNTVHNWIGGNMPTMRSPRDPLFYVHHANCDRIWFNWISLGNANPSNTLWRDFQFKSNFVRPTTALYSVRVRELLNISTQGYRYEQSEGMV